MEIEKMLISNPSVMFFVDEAYYEFCNKWNKHPAFDWAIIPDIIDGDEKQNDELLSQQMKNRILIVKNQYDERKVKSEVDFMPRGGSYQKKIMNYCAQKEIDLIAIAYHSESLLPQFDTFAQSLITNDQKIPCLILKSKLASALYF
jgi:hypothetical protein